MGHFFRFLISKAFLVNLLIIIGLGVGFIYGVLFYLTDYTNHGEVMEVPDLNGLTLDEAEAKLPESSSFMLEITDSLFKYGVKGGEIIEQSPKKGAKVKEGRRVYLTVAASHPPMITMPRLIDRSLRQATSLMETYGLKIGELIYKADLCTDCIVDQQMNGESVKEGSRIERGSVIDLVVGEGLGDELTAVPYLLGMNLKSAKLLLEAKSLNLGAPIYDDDVLTEGDSINAVIYDQSPGYTLDSIVRLGTPIDLFLGLDTNKVPENVISADTL